MKTKISYLAIGLIIGLVGVGSLMIGGDGDAGVQTVSDYGPYPRQDGFDAILISGATGTTSSGDTAAVAGLAIHGFNLYTTTGTATVRLMQKMNGSTRWNILKDVTLGAGDTQSYEAWNPLLVKEVRALVTACSTCNVTAEYSAQSLK